MNKNIPVIIIAILVAIAAIFMLTRAMGCFKAKGPASTDLPGQPEEAIGPKPEESSQGPAIALGTPPPVKSLALQAKEGPEEWKRDPFIILEKDLADLEKKFSGRIKPEKPELSQLKLTGIIYSKDRSQENYAVISGELLRVGDEFLGFKIAQILPNSVIIKWENQEFILELWQEEVK